jgi:hypothetical protein
MEDKGMLDIEKVQNWVLTSGIVGEVVRVEKLRVDMVSGEVAREEEVCLVAEEEMEEEWMEEIRDRYPQVIITSCYPVQLLGDPLKTP